MLGGTIQPVAPDHLGMSNQALSLGRQIGFETRRESRNSLDLAQAESHATSPLRDGVDTVVSR